ncbi:hypothetical protein SteCoe_19316 [Stentor coeruleus]|uniref:DUF2817 domain-containing protein n=1 Tax=Stentor coeruleus TaxID=5963 RepID=A0A1R2BUI1_9CILI|nr:hypothetical protein SteCoe_19316 [Stentor coeruleus]
MKHLYRKSQEKFLHACKTVEGRSEFSQYTSPLWDPLRKNLTTEYLQIGSKSAEKWLIISSGTYGLDFYIGSDIQTYITRMIGLNQIKLPDNISILIVHGINPWGAAWFRPSNINNVCLNYNFAEELENVQKKELADKNFKKLIDMYKNCESVINTIGWKFKTYHLMKTMFYYMKYGPELFYEGVYTHQRDNNIGLHYGGLKKQNENIELEKKINIIIPEDHTKVIHLDIQTSTKKNLNYYFGTEDKKSYDFFSKIENFPALNIRKHSIPLQSIISGIKSDKDNWISATFNIYGSGSLSRLNALRDENIFHNFNIWVENWARDEESLWPVDSYLESHYKRKLLKCYYPAIWSWNQLAIDNSYNMFKEVLGKLGNS